MAFQRCLTMSVSMMGIFRGIYGFNPQMNFFKPILKDQIQLNPKIQTPLKFFMAMAGDHYKTTSLSHTYIIYTYFSFSRSFVSIHSAITICFPPSFRPSVLDSICFSSLRHCCFTYLPLCQLCVLKGFGTMRHHEIS